MPEIEIKPLSVNDAWKGRRFRSDKYKAYQIELSLKLPNKIEIPEGKLKISIEWGLSSAGGDTDNPIKPFIDILSTKYGFNDNRVYQYDIKKTIVKKGKEYIYFKIDEIKA